MPVAATLVEPTPRRSAGGRAVHAQHAAQLGADDLGERLGVRARVRPRRRQHEAVLHADERRRGRPRHGRHALCQRERARRQGRTSRRRTTRRSWRGTRSATATFARGGVDAGRSACRGRRRSTSRSTATTTGCCSRIKRHLRREDGLHDGGRRVPGGGRAAAATATCSAVLLGLEGHLGRHAAPHRRDAATSVPGGLSRATAGAAARPRRSRPPAARRCRSTGRRSRSAAAA